MKHMYTSKLASPQGTANDINHTRLYLPNRQDHTYTTTVPGECLLLLL